MAVLPEIANEAPLYRLVEEESRAVLFNSLNVDGFFLDPDGGSSDLVRFLGVPSRYASRQKRLHDAELQVLDIRGEVMGAYYIGEAAVLQERRSNVSDFLDLDVSFFGYSCPFRHAGEIWRTWARGAPQKRGEWRKLLRGWHPSWLHVVQTAWFHSGRTASRYGSEGPFIIDGSGFQSIESLHCEMGEAINGPGGYFGSNLDALADCLRSSAGVRSFELIWDNCDLSEEALGEIEINSVVTLMREFKVSLTLRSSGSA
jgi:RNAse (barnase) inhibitor barstar